VAFLKFANSDLLEARVAHQGDGLLKSAHKAVFNYTPREGYLYVRSRAISNRTNDNFDTWPDDELRQAWGTFIGKPVFVNHHNDEVKRKRGVIIDAALHEDIGPDGRPDVWIEVLMEIDAVRFPKLAKAILAGDIERTSMGADVGESECSYCGNVATTPSTYCAHIKSHKGRRLARRNLDGSEEDVLVHEICIAQGEMVSTFRGLVPIEDVVVGDMALTRGGWRMVTDARQTGVRPTVKVTLSDGTTLRCTEDHLIATAAGWTPAISLLVGNVDTEAAVSVGALAGVHVSVFGSELVTPLAVGLEGVPVVESVGKGVDQSKMIGVDAVASSANVIDFDTLKIMPKKAHHSSVNQSFVVRVAADATVPIGGSGPLPDQAPLVIDCSAQESFEFVQAVCVNHDATVPVYDLTVEGEHEFVVNGIVVHNCRKISFFENSVLVEPPADPTAFVVGIDPNGVHDLLDMPPRVSVANRSDDRGSHVELGGDVSQRDLTSASSPASSRSSSRHATDLDHVGLSELRGSVPNTLGTASAAGHVGRVLSEGAQQPMGGVVAQRGVAGVPNDQTLRDRTNERLVAPAVGSDGAALGIVQRQASVPVGEDPTGPRPTGIWSARGVDLAQVPLHDRLGSLKSAADHVGYINTGARSFETGSWFHGTNHGFAPGDSVVPGLGAVHGNENDRVWVASNAWVASSYGSRTFEVTPTDKPKPRSKAGEFFCSGATVVREISNDEIRQAGNSWWEQTSKKAKLSSDAYVELTEEQKARFAGTTVRQDAKGFYCHTHRARGKSYPSIDEIPDDVVRSIESTGSAKTAADDVYTVVTQHGADREVRTATFPDFDAALAHAQATTPDTDPSLCPSVDEWIADHPGYDKGVFWLDNRYAVIIKGRVRKPKTAAATQYVMAQGGSDGGSFELHIAGCSDLNSPKYSMSTKDTITASSVDDAVAQYIDDQMIDQGWSTSDVKIFPCARSGVPVVRNVDPDACSASGTGINNPKRMLYMNCPECGKRLGTGRGVWPKHKALPKREAGFEAEVQEEMTKMATTKKNRWRKTAATQAEADQLLAGLDAEHRQALEKFVPYTVYGPGYNRSIASNLADAIMFAKRGEERSYLLAWSKCEAALDIATTGEDNWYYDSSMGQYTKRLASKPETMTWDEYGQHGEEKPELITWDEWEMAGSTNYGLGYSAGSSKIITLSEALDWGVPTDVESFTRGFQDAQAGRPKTASTKLAWGETKAPPQVNTLGLTECPVCATTNQFDSTGRCMTCGHLPAPDPFREPDLEVAQKVDMRDGWVNPSLLSAPAFVPPAEGEAGGGENDPKPDDPVQKASSATEVVEGPEGDTMRPSAAVIASQEQTIARLAAENAVLRRRAGLVRTADEENPAQPVPEPAPGAATQSTSDTRAADTTTEVTTPGAALTDVAPMTTTDVTTPGAAATEVGADATTEVTTPVAGTTEMVPYDQSVTLVQPDASGASNGSDKTNAFAEDNSWVQSAEAVRARTYACLRLAKLRVQAGLESGDELVIAQRIEANKPSNDSIRTEITTLEAVTRRQASVAPRRREAARSMPSLASTGSPMSRTASYDDDDSIAFW
jgi:hypothetical protein